MYLFESDFLYHIFGVNKNLDCTGSDKIAKKFLNWLKSYWQKLGRHLREWWEEGREGWLGGSKLQQHKISIIFLLETTQENFNLKLRVCSFRVIWIWSLWIMVHCTAKEPMDSWPEEIPQFLWSCVMSDPGSLILIQITRKEHTLNFTLNEFLESMFKSLEKDAKSFQLIFW